MSAAVDPRLDAARIEQAQLVLACDDLDDTLAFFTGRLGFRVAAIFPADHPSVAVLQGHGVRLRLEVGRGDPGTLLLQCHHPDELADGQRELVAPNGTRIELRDADAPLDLPSIEPSLVVTHLSDHATWGTGRAGMQYRDLLPGRWGGRFIASHIRIPDGGPVPDYVHYHHVRFQLIYCARGWVRVVYEDQGEPFVLHAGDCVLQPPRIRHRVLEASPGLEVIEVGCPAEHETYADFDLDLPTADLRPDRNFGGQRFVRHVAADAEWAPWRFPAFEQRDTGIGAATAGLAGVRVARPTAPGATPMAAHDGELQLWVVLGGAVELVTEAGPELLRVGSCVAMPAGVRHGLRNWSDDLELLEVTLPEHV